MKIWCDYLIIPSEEIGTEEEYFPGENVYVSDGKLKSSVVGELHIDSKRIATVIPYKEVYKFRVGDIVYGRIEEIFENFSLLTVEKDGITALGIIFISEIKFSFVKSIRDEFRIGDIVRAKVKKITPFSVELTTKDKELGVVKAFCSNCRSEMKFRGGLFHCEKCKNKEKRKFAYSV